VLSSGPPSELLYSADSGGANYCQTRPTDQHGWVLWERAPAGRSKLTPQAVFKTREGILIANPGSYRIIQVAQGPTFGGSRNRRNQIHAQGPCPRGDALGPIAAGRSDNRFVHGFLLKIFRVTPKQLKELSVGTFLYAGLFATEGIGLLLRKRWAEYFTIVTTGGLIPLEVYELWRHFTVAKTVVALVNVLIVWYLVSRVRSR
jgi:hypothetical protein